jgi:hypothetical protein
MNWPEAMFYGAMGGCCVWAFKQFLLWLDNKLK